MHRITSIYIFVALTSLLLSFWAVHHTFVINVDGICYLKSAEIMQINIATAMHSCAQAIWPFYSWLIFSLVQVTHLSYINAAYTLNGLFSLISLITFISIIRLLTPSPRILWFAALTLLFAQEFNAIRTDIVRDHGFWAFYLLSILCLLIYFHRKSQGQSAGYYALLWNSCLLIATLFRIEGAIFLLLLPFLAWCNFHLSRYERCKAFLQLNLLTFVFCLPIVGWIGLHHTDQSLGRVHELFFHLTHSVSLLQEHFNHTASALGQYVLSIYSVRDASSILFVMLMGWYILSVSSNLSIVYFALVLYAWWKKRLTASPSQRLVLWGYVAVNVIITGIFLTENLFLTKRYLMALSLVLMIWVPFALDNLFSEWKTRRWPVIVTVLLISYFALGGIVDFGYSKKYIYDAGEWAKINIPEAATIYSNDLHIMFYSNHFGNDIFAKSKYFSQSADRLQNEGWRQFDYIILHHKHHAAQNLLAKNEIAPIKIFENTRKDQILIYKINSKK